jgi:DNA excision repair protein ERCC-4
MKVNNLDLQNLSNLLTDLQAKAVEREKQKLSHFALSSPIHKPSSRIIITDSREVAGCRYLFPGYQNHVTKLNSGDYSISPYENLVSIERKEINDLVNTLIRGKERFQNELERLQNYENKCVVIEANYSDILASNYISQTLPQSVLGLIHSASYHNSIPFFFLSDFQAANRFTLKYLLCFARKKENNYNFPVPAKPLELRLEDTVLSYSLPDFIKEITVNKLDFKYYVNQLKAYKSSAIVLQCNYLDVINKIVNNSNIEDVVMSLIVDHGINVYFMQDENTAKRWIESHLKRYRPSPPPKEKKKRSAKKGSV